ncbi:MAG: RNA methyltransferase [Actinobacteria bacterium]|nr:RNA methyltransferase [Actinomycetota bacterium]
MKYRGISSTSNAIIKEAARLKRKRNRYESRLFLVEGEDLLDAALARGITPRQVFVLEGHEELVDGVGQRLAASAKGEDAGEAGAGESFGGRKSAGAEDTAGKGVRRRSGTDVYMCPWPVMEKISELGSGSRVVAVFDFLEQAIPKDLTESRGPLLYLCGMGDPGNVGTLIRSGASLGVSGVALAPGTADPYSPKALRATMGAIFQVPVFIALEPADLISRAKAAAIDIVCADPHEGVELWHADLAKDFALVLGSEREGVPEELLRAATTTVNIPQEAKTESLNVAMAGTVVLYEALRQRAGV